MSASARKIMYRCDRRGTKELDLILGSFAHTYVPKMDQETLQAFEQFIELPEPILQDMLMDKVDLPADLPEKLLNLLNDFRYVPEQF